MNRRGKKYVYRTKLFKLSNGGGDYMFRTYFREEEDTASRTWRVEKRPAPGGSIWTLYSYPPAGDLEGEIPDSDRMARMDCIELAREIHLRDGEA